VEATALPGEFELFTSLLLDRRRRIRPRVAVVKSVASAISIGSGGSVGRKGPIVQIGSAFGATLGQIIPMSASEKIGSFCATP
jgi:H+/Cl- antiporter ClcA